LMICIGYVNCFGQTVEICNIKTIVDIEKADIPVSEFTSVDTIIKGISYNLMCKCETGLIILGNCNEKGIKEGNWRFSRGNLFITGKFRKNKMSGKWFDDPNVVTYSQGKRRRAAVVF